MNEFPPPLPPARSPAAPGEVTGAGSCPHGDPWCPCQDGDQCHYEGRHPMQCPTTLIVGCLACR